MNSKIMVGTVAFIALFAAAPVSAQAPEARAGFCTNLTHATSQIEMALTKMSIEIQTALTKMGAQVGEGSRKGEYWSGQDTRFSQTRAEADQNRLGLYATLESRAATDSEKEAVASFKSAIESAVTARQAAIDAAMRAYREGIDTLLDGHVRTLDSARKDFETSINAAVTKAKADCADGTVTPVDIQTSFVNAIQSTRQSFQTARQERTLTTGRVTLASTREAAVEKAVADFRAAVEKAAADLKAALGTE